MTRAAYLWGQWHAAIGYSVTANPYLTGGNAVAWFLGHQDYIAGLDGRPAPRFEPVVAVAIQANAQTGQVP